MDKTEETETVPADLRLSEELGPAVPKRKDLGDLIDELVDVSVTLALARRPQSIQINSFKEERIKNELRERLEEVRLMMQTVDNLETRIAMERQAERDRCAKLCEAAVHTLQLPDSPQYDGDVRHVERRVALALAAAIRA